MNLDFRVDDGVAPMTEAQFHGMPEDAEHKTEPLQDLKDMVVQARKLMEIAWSKATAYPSLKDDPEAGRFSSLGQCAASARLLEDIIGAEYPNLGANNMIGKVVDGEGKTIAANHVWIEIPMKTDTLVVDITSDQREGLGNKAPKVVFDLKSNLEQEGFRYESFGEDTDERMQYSGTASFDRYKRLKRRYHRVESQEAYYKELLESNVYIISPVAAGKTELARGLEKNLNMTGIDVGKLFRMAAYVLINDDEENAIQPDYEKLKAFDQKEIDRIVGGTFRKNRLLQACLLEQTTLEKGGPGSGSHFLYQGKDISEELESDKVDLLVSAVARSQTVRDTIWQWIRQYCNGNGGVILTGHSLTDIDTSRFSVVQLMVSEKEAVRRFFERNKSTYANEEEAKAALLQRNMMDKFSVSEQILEGVRVAGKIDTSDLNVDEVRFRALRRLVKEARDSSARRAEQAKVEVLREEFSWEINPLVAEVRTMASGMFDGIAAAEKEHGVTSFDVAIQTLIHLTAREPSEVWLGDLTGLGDVQNLLALGQAREANERFRELVASDALTLNLGVVEAEARRQVERIKNLYEQTGCEYLGKHYSLPAAEMGNPDNSPFKATNAPEITKTNGGIVVNEVTGERMLEVTEKHTGTKIVFKKVPPEISEMYGAGFHYLHVGRGDERAAYGAYLEGAELPFAWVSYSDVDREYKRLMLEHMHTEPHRMLEMTRAWNASWSPKNTMSVLFAHAHSELQREWKERLAGGEVDKPLAGVVTAINGNLGFRANAFNGVGFVAVGYKPAELTFFEDVHGEATYMTRRALVEKLGLPSTAELASHPRYRRNQMPLIPTYEMVAMFDQREQQRISELPLYVIPSGAYAKS